MEPLKTLVVDDDIRMLSLHEVGLTTSIFDVRVAEDGQQALEIYQSWRPTIVLLDFILPYVTGKEVLLEIREKYGDSTTSVIMATGMSDKGEGMDCLRMGVQGYLIKPVNITTLAGRLLKFYFRQHPDQISKLVAKFKVLVLEPDEVSREPFGKGLLQEGFETRFAADDDEAMRLYSSWKPDIVQDSSR